MQRVRPSRKLSQRAAILILVAVLALAQQYFTRSKEVEA